MASELPDSWEDAEDMVEAEAPSIPSSWEDAEPEPLQLEASEIPSSWEDAPDFEPQSGVGPSYLEQPKLQPAPELFQPPTQSTGVAAPPGPPPVEVPFAQAYQTLVKPAWQVAQKFKKQHIDPVINFWQEGARSAYLGGEDPGLESKAPITERWASTFGPQDPNAPGQRLRRADPEAAAFIEGVGRLALGETAMNTGEHPEALHPSMKGPGGVQEKWRQQSKQAVLLGTTALGLGVPAEKRAALAESLSYTGGAAIQFALQQMGELPLWFIEGPGTKAAGNIGYAVSKGITSNVATAVVTPGADLEEAAKLGGVVGGGVGVGAKVGPELIGAAREGAEKAWATAQKVWKGKKLTVPIAVVPPDEIANFAEKAFNFEEPLIPSKSMEDVSVTVVGKTHDGETVTRNIRMNSQGVSAQTVGGGGRRPKGGIVLATPEVRDAVARNPEGPEAQMLWQEWKGPGTQPMVLDPKVRYSPDDLADMAAQSYGSSPDVMDGLVVAVEGGGGDGTARVHTVSSPELQVKILKARDIFEVTRADGSKHIGFPSPAGTNEQLRWGLVRPDTIEGIPGAATQDFVLRDDDTARFLSHHEIKDLVTKRKYAIEEAEEAALLAQADAQAAQADVAFGGNGDGRKLPPPIEGGGDPPPPPNPHQTRPTDVIKANWLQRVGATVLKTGRRNLVPPGVREKLHLADAATEMFSVDNFNRYRLDSLKSLQKVAPEIAQLPLRNFTDSAGKTQYGQESVLQDVMRFIRGELTTDQLRGIHPTMTKALYERAEVERQMTRALESKIVDLELMEPGKSLESLDGMSLEAGLEAYSTRLHMADLLPEGDWAKMARRDEAGRKSIVDDILKEFYEPRSEVEHYTKEDGTKGTRRVVRNQQWADHDYDARRKLAEKHFDFLAGEPEPREWFTPKAERTASKQALASLKARADLRPFELAVKGEILNPFVRVAETRARQLQLVLQGEVWQDVALNTDMSRAALSADEIASGNWIPPTETQSRRYGKARGLWINREVHDALVDIPLMQKNADSFLKGVIGTLKWNKTVGNPGRWAKNALESVQGIIFSNLGNPFTRPYHFGTGLVTFRKDYLAHMEAPGVDTRLLPELPPGTTNETRAKLMASNVARQRFKRMLEGGVLGSEITSKEFGLASKQFMEAVAEAENLNPGKVNFLDIVNGAAKVKNIPLDAMSHAYGAMDPASKYATAIVGLKAAGIDLDTGLIKDMKKNVQFLQKTGRYFPGMTHVRMVEEAEKEVFRRIALSFPMMDRVAPAAAAATKAADAGLLGMFVKMKFESNRVYAQLPNRILNEPGMKANMAAYAALVGGMAFGGLAVARKRAGVKQEDVDAAIASAPKSTQIFHPNTLYGWHRDLETGKLLGVDASFMMQPLSWNQGDDPNANIGVNAVRRVAGFGFGGTPYEPGLMSLMSEGGLAGEQYMRPGTPEYLQDSARFLGKFAEFAGPAGLQSAYKWAVQTGTGFNPPGGRSTYRGPASAAVAAGNVLLPGVFHESGGTADMKRALQDARMEYSQAQRERKQAQHKAEGQSTGSMTLPLNYKVALERAIANEIAKGKRLEELKLTFQKTGRYP